MNIKLKFIFGKIIKASDVVQYRLIKVSLFYFVFLKQFWFLWLWKTYRKDYQSLTLQGQIQHCLVTSNYL